MPLGFAGVGPLLRPTFDDSPWWAGVVGLVSAAVSAVADRNVRELVRADEPEARMEFRFGVFTLAGSLVRRAPKPGIRRRASRRPGSPASARSGSSR